MLESKLKMSCSYFGPGPVLCLNGVIEDGSGPGSGPVGLSWVVSWGSLVVEQSTRMLLYHYCYCLSRCLLCWRGSYGYCRCCYHYYVVVVVVVVVVGAEDWIETLRVNLCHYYCYYWRVHFR